MGQPPTLMPYAMGSAVLGHPGSRVGVTALLGVHRPIGSPVIGFGIDGEAYATAHTAEPTGGMRLLGAARAVNLAAGVDVDMRAKNAVFVMSWGMAARRGGVFGHGTMLRLDWLPARSQTLGIGVTVPLAQPHAGRTRPRYTGVTLPRGPMRRDSAASGIPAEAESALVVVRDAAGLIRLYTSFFSDDAEPGLADSRRAFRRTAEQVRDSLLATSPRYPRGRSYTEVQRMYGAALERAFSVAANGDSVTGAAVGSRARAGLLDHVILPYDTLFGRVKNRQHDIGGLTMAAQASFERWLGDSSTRTIVDSAVASAVHRHWLEIIESVHDHLVDQWDDSRRVWLPLQLALAPEQYDDQDEIDRLLARALGRPMTAGNAVTYLQSTDLLLEFGRSVVSARDYHVLWLHDFRSRGASGQMDRVGYREVADVYFPALTRAVERYDSVGTLPTFMVFIDQYFYEFTGGRLWMTILENPLSAAIRLPAGNAAAEAHLRARQRELNAAVARSTRLQTDAARRGGASWLRKTVKVHVNVTQPSDFSFRSHRIVPPLPFVPDNVMRDHRKIVFYDITEADPYRGAMITGGVGIGENYSSPTWDDRGMIVRGPAALEVRAAARRLLLLNGFSERDIPASLRNSATPEALATNLGSVGSGRPADGRSYAIRAIQAHNEPGFGRKQSSVARAMLYSLAPPGGVLVVPDFLWLGHAWAGMVAGAALRGCRVFVIAPTMANTPTSIAPVMSQANEVLGRLLEINSVFGDQMAQAGGELRIGLYAAKEDVNDVAKQAREIRAGLEQNPWIQALIPFEPAVLSVLDTIGPLLIAGGYQPTAPGRDLAPRLPRFHIKAQLMAGEEALAALARQPQWPEIVARKLIARARQTSADADPAGIAASRDSAGLGEPMTALAEEYESVRSQAGERGVSFYFAIGSQNHDERGMILDGEVTLVISGGPAALGLLDMYFLMARSTWVTDHDELDEHIPPHDGFLRWLGRLIRLTL